MKRSEMELRIQEKLRKQKHLFETYRKTEKLTFDFLIGNLCGRILTEVEEAGMLPPNNELKYVIKRESVPCVMNALKCHTWEEE